ncbi:MAG: LysR family transcriptional regulator [Bdellovibrionota bacterium]
MELNYLRYFYEVAKSGSFTEAARRLRISQSALSKSVALLENQEGVKLLERSKKGVSLTPIGVEVFLKSEGIFQTVADIENTCRGTKETCEGLLKFGASDHVTNYLLLDQVHQMRKTYPKVIPSIFSGVPNDIVSMILKNELEFGLFFSKINVPGINYEPLFPVKMAIVCHPSLIPEKQGSLSSARLGATLKKQGLIGSIKSQYQSHPSKNLIDLMGKDPSIVFESNSQETQKRFCLQGGGIAYLARFIVEKEIEGGRLVEIHGDKPLTLQLLLAKRKGMALSLSAITFINLIKKSQA